MPLKPKHCQYITARAVRHMRWLDRLTKRMEAHRVPPNDPLMIAVRRAYDSMHSVRVQSMYGTMEHGAGKPADGDS